MKLTRALQFGFAGLLTAGVFVQAAQPTRPDFSDRIERGPSKQILQAKLEAMDWYGSREAINLRFTLTNPTAESLWVAGWMLPSADMDNQLFTVKRDGEPVTYLGILAKRAAAMAEEWIEIKAGQSYTVTFDPTADYDMSGKGQYSVEFRVRNLEVRTKAPRAAMNPDTNLLMAKPIDADTVAHGKAGVAPAKTELFYEGAPAEALPLAQEMTIIGGYTKCTTTQKATFATAHANATLISGLAVNAVGTGTFTKWFGTNSAASVKPHYVAINDAFANKSVTYDCSCKKPSTYAYVYPTQPYKIYVCGAFWNAPMLGRDSKAGTLVHEMSHFKVVVGTSDYVYGASGAANLAITNPAQAFMNADNHEYFAEDQKMQ